MIEWEDKIFDILNYKKIVISMDLLKIEINIISLLHASQLIVRVEKKMILSLGVLIMLFIMFNE